MFRLVSANLLSSLKQSLFALVLFATIGFSQNIFANSCGEFYLLNPIKSFDYGMSVINYRNQQLAHLDITLGQFLDAVYSVGEGHSDSVIALSKIVNPKWTLGELDAGIKQARSLIGQAKLVFKKKNFNSAQNLIQTEFIIRYYPEKFLTFYQNNAKEMFSNIFAKHSSYPTSTEILNDYRHAKDGISFLENFYGFYNRTFGQSTISEQKLAEYAWARWSVDRRGLLLKSWVKENRNSQLSRSLMMLATADSSLGLSFVIKLAFDLELWKNDPHFLKALIETAYAKDSKFSDARNVVRSELGKVIERDLTEGLKWTSLVKTLSLAGNFSIEVGNYQKLLSVGPSSAVYRNNILQEIVSLGKGEIATYVGNDIGSNRRLLTLIDLKVTDAEIKKKLEDYLVSVYFDDSSTHSASIKAKILKKYPHIVTDDVVKKVYEQSDEQTFVNYLNQALPNQSSVNNSLIRAMQSVIAANAPPKMFTKMSNRPWTAYLESIPMIMRAEHTTSLLKKNAGSAATLSEFVSKLDPIPGVVTAVVQFFADGTSLMNSNRTDFTQEQVLKMFGGRRFNQFFPHTKGVALDGAIRTKFALAVRLAPIARAGINLAWLSEKLDANDVRAGIPGVYGFRPALQYNRFRTQLNANFDDNSSVYAPADLQARGLIVQGFYEKQGFSLMDRLNGERGDDQVETTAPQLVADIEKSLRAGYLSRQSTFVKSHMVKYWALNKDSSLIDSIRSRAIRVANSWSQFYNLRVEIHNFPTNRTLALVKNFRHGLTGSSDALSNLDALIAEIESFLRVGDSAAGVRNVISNRLVLSDTNRSALLEDTKDFDSAISPLGKAERLLSIRNRFDEIKDASSSGEKEIERYRGQAALSEAGVAIFNGWLENFSSTNSSERILGTNIILKHMRKDGFLSADEVAEISAMIKKVEDRRNVPLEKKLELRNRILNSVLDRIYFELFDKYGVADNSVYRTHKASNPVKFVDDTLRSGFPLILAKIIEKQAEEIARAKNVVHEISGTPMAGIVHVHNRGVAVGVLRVNKDPMTLSENDIAVMEDLPAESAPVAGFISVGVGARLSHLQLLAKSLKIPNVQVDKSLLKTLKDMDGQLVRIGASEDGQFKIERIEDENKIITKKRKLAVPKPNHGISTPINFVDYQDPGSGSYAGPKGIVLAKLFQSGQFVGHVEDGVILPFGFFNRYAEKAGIKELLKTLSQVNLSNRHLIGTITAVIQSKISKTPIPEDMINEVYQHVEDLRKRTGKEVGFFFRSDTNAEDLPDFNGAGLNESVPNVALNKEAMDKAIRQVWLSPLSEKSIYWRGLAIGKSTVTIAEPSVVIMPTVQAKSSGVLISRGGVGWNPAYGSLNANFGIGSVVQAERPVEEYTFELGVPLRVSLTTSSTMPVADSNGGLVNKSVPSGTLVLADKQPNEINKLGQQVENYLGVQLHGWDIEWAIDQNERIIILQARPNM